MMRVLRAVALVVLPTVATIACGSDDLDSKKEPGCPNDQLVCSDQCVDLRSNPDHCGVCDLPCNSTDVCSRGICKDKCDDGLKNCSRACVNTYTDPDNCGGCQVACEADRICALGTCSLLCNNECGDICTDITVDAFNCGECGNRCDVDQGCKQSKCVGICELFDTCGGGCSIESATYEVGTINPNNPCEVCSSDNPSAWSSKPVGSECGDGMVCKQNNECAKPITGDCIIEGEGYAIGDPNPSNPCESCTASNQTGWTATGVEGGACADGLFCNAAHQCVAGCSIDGKVYSFGTKSEANPCQSCLAAATTQWSNSSDEGDACGDGLYCDATHACVDGCFIEGTVYPVGTVCETNSCKSCTADSSTQWSGTADEGDPCGDGRYCDAENECVDGCLIDGTVYAINADYADNDCMHCQAGDREHWTAKSMGASCSKSTKSVCDGSGECVIPVEITAMSARWNNTCAIIKGKAQCWGYNNHGQLGDNTTTSTATPVMVQGLDIDVLAVSTGNSHTCVINKLNNVLCWGLSELGQIGSAYTGEDQLTPTLVNDSESTFTAISSGAEHTCAVTTDGKVKCWGFNNNRQLGSPGAIIDRPTEVSPALSGIISVATGPWHSCAMSASAVWCWGLNSDAQVGTGTASSIIATPTEITAVGGDVVAITAGQAHTCVLTKGREVKCWGSNERGQLGIGSTTDGSTEPLTIPGLEATAIAAGYSHTCAITVAGTLMCWGGNICGQVGDGTLTNASTPRQVKGLPPDIVGVAAANEHTCAFTKV
ncbi:MAG: hypothetical protein FWD57_12470, partial [Polyangiaceae bacterium]|nr:hypothetical protein [Polyangiaceae bacterium]